MSINSTTAHQASAAAERHIEASVAAFVESRPTFSQALNDRVTAALSGPGNLSDHDSSKGIASSASPESSW